MATARRQPSNRSGSRSGNRSSKADDPEEIGRRLWRASLRWRRAVQEALRPFDLTVPQYLVLASLVRLATPGGNPCSQRALSEDADLDKMTTSHAVRALDDGGLVTREVQKGDMRRWGLLPTQAGERLLRRASPVFASASASFVAPLGAQAASLGRLLRQLG